MWEWLAHHALEGATQFVLLDQQSMDNGPELVKAFAASRPDLSVQLFPAVGDREQDLHYGRHIHRLSTDWLLVIDLDEFAYARGHATIPHFLSSLPQGVGSLVLPWKVFGSNSQVLHPRSGAISAFTQRHGLEKNDYPGGFVEVKPLFRMASVRALLSANGITSNVGHLPMQLDLCGATPELKPPGCFLNHVGVQRLMDTYLADGITPAQRHFLVDGNLTAGKVGKLTGALVTAFGVHLNHYRTGSCESWLRGKMSRGRADMTQIQGWNSFREMDRYAGKVRDNELARKRGTQWTVMLGNVSWTWSTRNAKAVEHSGRVTPGPLCRAQKRQLQILPGENSTSGRATDLTGAHGAGAEKPETDVLNTSMHRLVGSTQIHARSCLPFELSYGRWTGTTELFTLPDNGTALSVVPNASWKVFSDCAIASFTHAHELASKLDARNASILLVGDSRTRRLFFRMASILKQQEIDLMMTNDLRTSGEFGTVWAHHQQEKLACEKDMRTTTKGNRSRDNCFGLCSCSTRVSGVQIFFLWQVDAWFNERVEWAWNRLLAKAGANEPRREIILILGGSGLLLAAKKQTSLLQLSNELPALSTYLHALPRNVHVIWQSNVPSQGRGPSDDTDLWQAAQDGLARVGLSEQLAAWLRVARLDVRPLYAARADCYDHAHCAGGTTDINVQQLMHIALNWEELIETGLGREFQEQPVGVQRRAIKPYKNFQGRWQK